MKKIIIALALIATTTLSFGQECTVQDEPNYNGDKDACRMGISLYTEPLKQENFPEAASNWWKAQKTCPQYKPLLYDNGVYIYKQLALAITDKNSEAFKGKMDTLNTIYDLWVKTFGDCYEIQMERGHSNMTDEAHRYDKAYKFFQLAFKNTPREKLQSYDVVYYYRAVYFMQGAKLIDCEKMMNIYEEMDALCVENIKKNQDAGNSGETQNWLTAQQTIETYIAPCANCEQMIKIYEPQLKDDPSNLELKKKVFAKLDKLKCKEPIMDELIGDIYNLEPSLDAAIGLGNAKWKKGKKSDAKKYFDDALADPNITSDQKNRIYSILGNDALGKNNKSAFKYGKLIGGCEGKYLQAKAVAKSATSCATNRTQRTAVYSYALDLAEAAGSCVSSSWKAGLKKQLSTKTDLFTGGLKPGDAYDVPCWGVKVKLRVQ